MTRCSVFAALIAATVLFPGIFVFEVHAQSDGPTGGGSFFPEIPLRAPADAAGRDYLGLPDRKTFTLGEIQAEVVLVEVLSTFCPSCLEQTELYGRLFRRLERDPRTRGKVRMLGVAVANTEEEIAAFRSAYRVPFPVVPDRHFLLHRALGSPQAPYTLLVRQNPGRPGVIADTHQGIIDDLDLLRAELAELAAKPPVEVAAAAPGAGKGRPVAAPLLSEPQLQARVREAFAGLGGKAAAFREVPLESGRRVFTALVAREGKKERFFAEAVSRPSLCDVCHDIHFVYLFDTAGRVVGFVPIHLTKYGNAEWSEADAARMRRRVMGLSITASRTFDPKVDAVTSATMTSAVIFDQLFRGEELMAELRKQGLL